MPLVQVHPFNMLGITKMQTCEHALFTLFTCSERKVACSPITRKSHNYLFMGVHIFDQTGSDIAIVPILVFAYFITN